MRERVQVQAPQGPQQLQVTARPGAAVAQAPRIGTSRGQQLARALAEFEPALRAHLNEAQEEFEIKESERAYDTLQGMTFEEAQKLVDSGQLRKTENPWYEAAFQKQFGVSYAGKRKRDMMLAYETSFDKHNGDIEQFITGYIQEDAAKYGNNEFVRSGIREGMGDFLGRLRDQHAEFRAADVRMATADQFYGAAATVVDEAVSTGQDPSAAVRSLYEQHRTAFGMTYQEMDEHVLTLAERYAEQGDSRTVKALLETEVVGGDGQKVGSFTNRAKYADRAATLINKAEAKNADLDREALTHNIVEIRVRARNGQLTDDDQSRLAGLHSDGVISQEFRESLLVQNENARGSALVASENSLAESGYKKHVTDMLVSGRAFGITDYTYTDGSGKEHTLSRDQVLGEVVNDTLTAMARSGYSENEMAATLASWGTGETFEVWENALTDGYLSINQSLLRAGPDGEVQLPEAAMAGYQTWKNLGEHPNLRSRHVTDSRALAVYRDAEALERGGFDPQTALIQSASISRDPGRASLSSRVDANELASAVRKAGENGWSRDAENGAFISHTVETTARVLIDKGLPASRAVKEAQRMFEESHTVINGVAVNTRNKLIPPQFDDISELIIEEFADLHDENPRDLTLVPSMNGEQNWVIARKDTLLPHEEWANGGQFSVTQLQERGEDIDNQTREAARKQAAAGVEVAKIRSQPVKVDENFSWPTDTSQRWATFRGLDRKHRRNILSTPSNGAAYKRLQETYGKQVYPDGGIPTISPDTR